MPQQGLFEKILVNGLSYEQYLNQTFEDGEKILPENSSEVMKSRHSILKLNIQRMKRVEKSYNISDEMLTELTTINEKQLWMIISEPWCGDSAQIVSQIAKIVKTNNLIELKILLRDENPDVMDLYVSDDNKRRIPVLVIFDEAGEELAKWGSRPAKAEKLINQFKAEGLSKVEYLAKLHLWYAQNKGQEIEKELISLLKTRVIAI